VPALIPGEISGRPEIYNGRPAWRRSVVLVPPISRRRGLGTGGRLTVASATAAALRTRSSPWSLCGHSSPGTHQGHHRCSYSFIPRPDDDHPWRSM